MKKYFFLAVLGMSSAALAQYADPTMWGAEPGRFTIVSMNIDNVRQPHSIFDKIAECGNNENCMAVAEAIGEAYGIPVGEIVGAAGIIGASQKGEGTYMRLSPPSGYKYCRSTMSLKSIVPNDGPRGSTFLGRADDDSLYVETWTPVLQPFEGRSWVEGNVTLIAVKDQYAEEEYQRDRCARGGSRIVFYCRGSGCKAGAQDQGQSLDASSPPGAGGRK